MGRNRAKVIRNIERRRCSGRHARLARGFWRSGSAAQGAPVTEIKTGVISPLQEDESRYYATAVVEKTKDHLKLATVEWPKEPVGVLESQSGKPGA